MIWIQRANALSRVIPLVGEEEVLMVMVIEKHMRISSRTIIYLFKFASSPLNVWLGLTVVQCSSSRRHVDNALDISVSEYELDLVVIMLYVLTLDSMTHLSISSIKFSTEIVSTVPVNSGVTFRWRAILKSFIC